jgi:hypothetical protein
MHHILCKSRKKKCDGTLTKIRKAFGEESISRTSKVQTHRNRKKASQVKSKVKIMLIIFSDIKGNVHKEFVLAGQAVISAYYCDVLW